MAKGRDKHQAHKQAVAGLGRPLSRRAKSSCELCSDRTSLRVVEIAGNPEPEPDQDWALMICPRCEQAMAGTFGQSSTLRFLETAVWSELAPVQIQAVRLLRQVDTTWARDCIDGLYLDPEIESQI